MEESDGDVSKFDTGLTTLAVGATALKYIGSVGTINVSAVAASQLVRDLAVIISRDAARSATLLSIRVDETDLRRESRAVSKGGSDHVVPARHSRI